MTHAVTLPRRVAQTRSLGRIGAAGKIAVPAENRSHENFLPDALGPFVGLDVGDVRIGVAASDATALIARPEATISRTPKRECLNRLETILREKAAGGVVVGLPLLETGAEGEQAAKTRAFLRSLTRRLPRLRVAWWDERHSTGDAREWLAGRGEFPRTGGARGRVSGGARGQAADPAARSRRDEIAAAMLLQEWLDERRRRLASHKQHDG